MLGSCGRRPTIRRSTASTTTRAMRVTIHTQAETFNEKTSGRHGSPPRRSVEGRCGDVRLSKGLFRRRPTGRRPPAPGLHPGGAETVLTRPAREEYSPLQPCHCVSSSPVSPIRRQKKCRNSPLPVRPRRLVPWPVWQAAAHGSRSRADRRPARPGGRVRRRVPPRPPDPGRHPRLPLRADDPRHRVRVPLRAARRVGQRRGAQRELPGHRALRASGAATSARSSPGRRWSSTSPTSSPRSAGSGPGGPRPGSRAGGTGRSRRCRR